MILLIVLIVQCWVCYCYWLLGRRYW